MTRNLLLLPQICALVIVIGALTSCGKKKDFGADLEMALVPSSVLIAPGSIASCKDILDGEGSSSVNGPFVYFPRFVLNWKSTEKYLYIASIRVTVTGRGIADGETKSYLDPEEMKVLIGTDIMPPGSISVSTITGAEPPYIQRSVSCGFTFGGIKLSQGEQTQTFKATIKVELIGTAAREDFTEQEFVKQSFTVKADYFEI